MHARTWLSTSRMVVAALRNRMSMSRIRMSMIRRRHNKLGEREKMAVGRANGLIAEFNAKFGNINGRINAQVGAQMATPRACLRDVRPIVPIDHPHMEIPPLVMIP